MKDSYHTYPNKSSSKAPNQERMIKAKTLWLDLRRRRFSKLHQRKASLLKPNHWSYHRFWKKAKFKIPFKSKCQNRFKKMRMWSKRGVFGKNSSCYKWNKVQVLDSLRYRLHEKIWLKMKLLKSNKICQLGFKEVHMILNPSQQATFPGRRSKNTFEAVFLYIGW